MADPNGAAQYGGAQMPGQYGQNARNTGSWQAAGPQQAPGWGAGQGPQQGPNVRSTGSWQAAGPAQGPYGPGARNTGSWQAAPGYGGDPRDPGAWQAQGPEQGQGWAAAPAGGPGNRNTGSWQAAGQQPGPGWASGQEQSGQGMRNTGSWQAAPGQGWPGPGQQPYQGQPYPGQQHPGQHYSGAGASGMRNTGGFSRVGSPIIRQRDSALPDPVPGAKGPIAAIETDNIAAFARDLRVLRAQAGLDYPDMAEKSHYTMRTLASAAGGLRLPTLPVLIAYINACGGDIADWEDRWSRLSKSAKQRTAVAIPDGTPQPGQPQGPGQQNPRQTGEIYVITSAKQREGQW